LTKSGGDVIISTSNEREVNKMTRPELIKSRMKILKEMDAYIYTIGDENLTDRWLMCGLPDGWDDEDLADIACDDTLWKEICELFGKIIVSE
jgi:hypothetical protein